MSLDKSKVYVCLSTSDDLVSRIIRWFTKSRVSHAFFLYWDDKFQRWNTAGAMAPGFEIIAADRIFPANRVVAIYEPVDLNPIMPDLDEWLSDMYNYPGLIGMALVEIGRWLKRKWHNPLTASNSLFCSQAVAQALILAKQPNFDLDPTTTAPSDLDDFFQRQNVENQLYKAGELE